MLNESYVKGAMEPAVDDITIGQLLEKAAKSNHTRRH